MIVMRADDEAPAGSSPATMPVPRRPGRLAGRTARKTGQKTSPAPDRQDHPEAMAKSAQVRRAPGWRRAGLLLSGAAVPLCWLTVAPAQAALPSADRTRTVTVTVGDIAEAWYADSPVDICTTPLGCPPDTVPASPYPEDTLHVGVAGGQETARTYVVPDLTTVPFGAHVTAAVMTLPVATGDQDGNQAPETAKLTACLATEPVADGTQGSTTPPPPVDCKTSAKADYDAKKGVFTLDLSPFTTAWAAGSPSYGIGLVPDPTVQPTDAWHVAFNGRERKHADHITSVVTFTPPAPIESSGTVSGGVTDTVPAPPADTATPPSAAGAPLPPVDTAGTAGDQPPPDVAAAPAVAPAQQPVALSREFQYPMAFLLPLALLAGGVFFVRLFTRDATPRMVPR
jgi:hypothetical protein